MAGKYRVTITVKFKKYLVIRGGLLKYKVCSLYKYKKQDHGALLCLNENF